MTPPPPHPSTPEVPILLLHPLFPINRGAELNFVFRYVCSVLCKLFKKYKSTPSVADPDPFDTDPDPACHFDTDPDHAFQSDPDPDPTV
jgi:hypothetical protein